VIVGKTKIYPIIQDEPQLGKQYETIIEIEPEDVYEKLAEMFESGDATSVKDTVQISNTDLEFDLNFTLSEFMTQDDINRLNNRLELELLDDDWGGEKMNDIMEEELTKHLPDDNIEINIVKLF